MMAKNECLRKKQDRCWERLRPPAAMHGHYGGAVPRANAMMLAKMNAGGRNKNSWGFTNDHTTAKKQSSNAAPRKQGCVPMVVSSIAIFEMADMNPCHACAVCVVFEKVLRRHRGG